VNSSEYTCGGIPFDAEPPDHELGAILASVHDEMLAQAHATADPAGALVAIMASDDETPVHGEMLPRPTAQSVVFERLGAVIGMRHRATEIHHRLGAVVANARQLARDLDRELNHHGDLAIGMTVARAFARHCDRRLAQVLTCAHDLTIEIAYDLTRIRRLDRDLAMDRDFEVVRELSHDIDRGQTFDGVRELDRALALNRQLTIDQQITEARELSIGLDWARSLSDARERCRSLNREDARQLALAIDLALVRARELAFAVMHRLNALEVDVSSADLSQASISDPAVLTGVIWTEETIWPPDLCLRVCNLSDELGPGIYQVRAGGPRHSVQLDRHAAGRLQVSGR